MQKTETKEELILTLEKLITSLPCPHCSCRSAVKVEDAYKAGWHRLKCEECGWEYYFHEESKEELLLMYIDSYYFTQQLLMREVWEEVLYFIKEVEKGEGIKITSCEAVSGEEEWHKVWIAYVKDLNWYARDDMDTLKEIEEIGTKLRKAMREEKEHE